MNNSVCTYKMRNRKQAREYQGLSKSLGDKVFGDILCEQFEVKKILFRHVEILDCLIALDNCACVIQHGRGHAGTVVGASEGKAF